MTTRATDTALIRFDAQPPATGSSTAKISLCVSVGHAQSSVERGHVASWTINAWAKGGNIPGATIKLTASPGSVSPKFSFGCGSLNGTTSCDLGEVVAQSAARQMLAKVTVPATATAVTSVELHVTARAANLTKDPTAAATIAVTAAPTHGTGGGGNGGGGNGSTSTPSTTTSPLPVGTLPTVSSSPTLSPGGNAGTLFPTISPSPNPKPGTQGQKASARTVANTSALPLGAPVVGAQLIGLAVLALAFVLAVTRLSIRRRPTANRLAEATAGAGTAAGGKPEAEKDAKDTAKDSGESKDTGDPGKNSGESKDTGEPGKDAAEE